MSVRNMYKIEEFCSKCLALSCKQSVTYRYREFPIPGIFHFFGGIGTGIGTNWYRKKSLRTGIGKIWYRKKVSEPVSEKIGTGADYFGHNFGIQKISNGYREFFIFSGGIGTCIGKIWYWKKS